MPVSQVQILPTLGEVCELAVPKLDGPSLAPQLRNSAAVSAQAVYAEYNLQNPRAKYMLRQGEYKYTFWANDIPELYDLRGDPDEMNNLALQPKYKSRIDALKAQLFDWYKPPEVTQQAVPLIA